MTNFHVDEYERILCTCVYFISLQLCTGMSLFFGAALDDVVLRVVHNAGIHGLLAYNGYCAMARTGEGGREGGREGVREGMEGWREGGKGGMREGVLQCSWVTLLIMDGLDR